ncbi:hypothetical protein [Pelagibacterium halotolerans]|uniref:DUF2628 domain-containing protein n=1 Tax=Pelagibacterium halotolerans (strain DSM 22347 / JCM 15775 / CGMCC 1.7692 / B2) TaxID=1082931 RepID=G4R7S4_PELHB|nr:hypothetical protein [Pelagibacterium halotolerans]AEQ53334.1 hypothetical protein KKY_3347 [Pelagibacterium halotolerans B2]QJR17053.1 hypothetical protein HKM20_00365 [Pelagibacterium halotolerans]SEA62765.1 hypothetical protein SAMN05428936_105255 [Pelagibacterium halotolerans]
MTLYAIYAKPENGPDAIWVLPDKFSWGAFLFAPFWALARGAIAYLLLWIAVAIGLFLLAPHIGGDLSVLLYLIFALWTGFAATPIAGQALENRNWIASGELAADSTLSAEQAWLEKNYGPRP